MLLLAFGASQLASAQSLPAPARTVFKCMDDGSVTYSDSPCLGAEKLEIEPTRGVSSLSGKARVGRDVSREERQERMAEALKPLTGMDAGQFAQHGRRIKLESAAQRECRLLDRQIPDAEALEASSGARADLAAAQAELYRLRVRYRDLRC